MSSPTRALMAVHAHPDDEASSTGGTLARYSDEGVRTVLVTCTNGEMGDAPGGVKPGEPGHDPEQVAALRRSELEASCSLLGVRHLEMLGYRDSGMMGWPQNDDPASFWQTPVDEAAARLAELMERYRPQVVVTYDPQGFYGHPDHIQAHRITVAAAEATGIPDKLYYVTIPKSSIERLGELLREAGIDPPQQTEDGPEIGTDDAFISAFIDCTTWAGRKFESLSAHASQVENNAFLLAMGPDRFAEWMGREAYVRARDRTGAPLPEDDLFAGVLTGPRVLGPQYR